MAWKLKCVSEEDLKFVMQTVQRLREQQKDEQRWLNFISDNTQRDKDSAASGNAPCTHVIDQHHRTRSSVNFSQLHYCEDLRKCDCSLENSEVKSVSSNCLKGSVGDACSNDVTRIKYCRSRISATLDSMMRLMDKMPVPEDEKDLARRTLRASEFSSMFTRNYLYQLQRNERDLKKQQSMLLLYPKPPVSQLNSVHHKLATAYHVGLQAVLVYLNHIPKTIMYALPGKLKNLLAYICHLEMVLGNLNVQVDDTGSSDVMMSKCENLLALINTKKQDAEFCTCTVYHGRRVKHNEQKKKQFKLSPYKARDSQTVVDFNKSKLCGTHKKRPSCLKMKPLTETKVIADTSTKHNWCPSRRHTSCTSSTTKEENVSRAVKAYERSQLRECKESTDLQSRCDNDNRNKDLKLCEKSALFDVKNKGRKTKLSVLERNTKTKVHHKNHFISENQEPYQQEEPLSPSSTCSSASDNKNSHLCDTKFIPKVRSIKRSFRGNDRFQENDNFRRHEKCLLDDTSSCSAMFICVTDDKNARLCGAGGAVSYPLAGSETAEHVAHFNCVDKPNPEHPHSITKVVLDPTRIQLHVNEHDLTSVNLHKFRNETIWYKNNMKIPWNTVTKICDSFVQQALQDIVKEAEDTLCDIGNSIFENEFKCLFP